MLRGTGIVLLVCTLLVSASTIVSGYSHCNCDDEGFWSLTSILECQKVSDFLIAVAYFSIPIELIYFISCSNLPFKWVLVEFIAFIVLCGMTHLLNGWIYYGPHSFQLILSLTIFKFLTALVSCATAITLITLIPLLLKIKVREVFLRQNVLELDQEVGMMKKKKEASWHVRMLTREIRRSLDKHTVLYTTLVELSKTLDLQNCAVWMPNETKTALTLTHELKPSDHSKGYSRSIPVDDPDVREISENKGVRILRPDSALGIASSGDSSEPGSVAAIRMPMLNFSNFKGGTPEVVQACYAILVLVLPNSQARVWSFHELEIVEVVADQVAVALSHAKVLEESQLMREKLGEQNRILQQARKDAVMANQARDSFQKVMSQGMRRPMHSIIGLLSMFEENLSVEQKIIVDTMVRTSNVLSTLINDVMEIPAKDNGRFPLEMRHFHLHSMIKEASCLAKCLFVYQGIVFSPDVQSSLPEHVIGDERRTFQVLLHMVGYLLHVMRGGSVVFRVYAENGSEGKNDKWGMWRPGASNDFISIKFEFDISGGYPTDAARRTHTDTNKEGLSFTMCKRLAQMMQGDIWVSLNPFGLPQRMTLVLRFQNKRYLTPSLQLEGPQGLEQNEPNSLFNGLRVLVADDDNMNRKVTKRVLEKLGCEVSAVSSGFECLSAAAPSVDAFRVILLDLHMPDIDGFEVAKRIRKLHARNGPVIIALTASAEDDIWERCIKAGINGLIWKPVVLQGIVDELRRVLQ